jgi:hypothetical protein
MTLQRLANEFNTTWEEVSNWNILKAKARIDYINHIDKLQKLRN